MLLMVLRPCVCGSVLKRVFIVKRFIFHGSKSILVPKMICRPPKYDPKTPEKSCFYALYVCITCMYHYYERDCAVTAR
jgi:hypothetical protein